MVISVEPIASRAIEVDETVMRRNPRGNLLRRGVSFHAQACVCDM